MIEVFIIQFQITRNPISRVPAGEEADWTREFRNNSMFLSVALRKWCVVVPQRSTREAREFIRCIRQAAQGMRMEMEEPQV